MVEKVHRTRHASVQHLVKAMKNETKVTVCGWIAVAVTAVLLALCVAFAEPYKPPPASTWPTEKVTVNTAMITHIEPVVEGDRTYSRVSFGKFSYLYAEHPTYFQGITQIKTATRIKTFNN
jgi:hypothetical protein